MHADHVDDCELIKVESAHTRLVVRWNPRKYAWFEMHRVRLAMQNDSVMKLGGNGIHTEVDETFTDCLF